MSQVRKLISNLFLRRTINGRVYRGEQVWVGECRDIAVVTQGSTLDEAVENLGEAIGLYFDEEDSVELGFSRKACAAIFIEKQGHPRAGTDDMSDGLELVRSLTKLGFHPVEQWGHLKLVRIVRGRREIVVLPQAHRLDNLAFKALKQRTDHLFRQTTDKQD